MRCAKCHTELFDDGSENDQNRPVIPDSPHGRPHWRSHCLAVVVAQRDVALAKLKTAREALEEARRYVDGISAALDTAGDR